MVEFNSAEKLNIDFVEGYSTDVMTGDRDKRMYLYYQLIQSLKKAESVDIIVSFLMESGVKMLLGELENALARGAQVRILTGNYLGITQPSALYLIKRKLGDRVDLRFYNEKERSFHPKSYIFHYSDYSELYIGSSNISRSALTSGIEWNYRFSSKTDQKNYDKFFRTFEELFENHSIVIDDEELRRYSKNWHRPAVSKDLDKYDVEDQESEDTKVRVLFEPRGAQIEALCALEDTRAEGARRALIQAATGVGKTYLAAFDSKEYERVLFVAHREEILNQAAVSFKNVRNSDDYGFFNGNEKCKDKSVVFASVATLGRSEYLNKQYFSPDYFQYVVIDEFHHAVNEQYRRIAEYFKPQFLLGLTATPERMDGRNIYELCDYNVPYEISLKDAINKGMLVPFHYYGIFDDTDYSGLHIVRGKYDEKELNETYIGNVHRHELIYKYYCKYGSKRALGFCCSRAHAEEMAREFCKRGIPSVAVYSNSDGEFSEDRSAAIEKLKNGEIKVIFSVDMFNEGVDITSVDMVLFLRPTESPIVFLQQLGRGLRRSKGKEYLNVLDFIGNYEKAGRVRFLLTGRRLSEKENYNPADRSDFPDDCLIDFDMKLIDLFAEMDKRHLKVKDQIRNEFFRIKDLLGNRPSRIELFTYMDDDIYQMAISHSKDNPFKRYLEYLKEMESLNAEEEALYQGLGREFINLIETTNMSKVYKMPVLMAFYNHGNVRMSVTEEELLESWKEFFCTGTNWKDLETDITYERFLNISDQEHVKKILQMPVHFLQESGKGFFVKRDGSALALREELSNVICQPGFAEQMKDVIEYRAMDYYQRRYREKEVRNG
jgi:superfamily II DNA or RNA helicase/HKD family nuclease